MVCSDFQSETMDWREKHEQVIKELLDYINDKGDSYILKGGTALKQCCNLDRFSEDIDLDGKKQNRV